MDLEPIEMLVRDTMHRAGAATVQRLLSLPVLHNHTVPCPCGQKAQFRESRRKQLLTILGPVVFERAYYLCGNCHQGQSPRDQELDVVGKECSPGVRRMIATVGSESSFDRGRQHMELLAGIEITTKAVERDSEAIGRDIVRREQEQRNRLLQLEFPDILSAAVPRFVCRIGWHPIADGARRVGRAHRQNSGTTGPYP